MSSYSWDKHMQEQIERGLSSGIKFDPVNHPKHYKGIGFCECGAEIEAIQITRHMDFLTGNVVKYLLRAGKKGNKLEDLKKAAWYLNEAIDEEESK